MRRISRGGSGGWGGGYGFRFDISEYFPRAIKTLCLICVGVFLLQELSRFFFHAEGWNFWLVYFGVSPYAILKGVSVFGLPIPAFWQPVTYLFLHATIWHILFNLLYLAMFGAALEHMWGAKKFYTYFFLCGVGAGLIDLAVRTALDPHMQRLALMPTIGASGAIYGVLLAAAVVMPHQQVWMFPLPVTISMRLFVIVMGAIEFFMTLGATGDGVSHFCHLGGMLVGYLYLRRGSHLYNFRNYFSDWKRRRLRKKFDVYVREHRDKPPSRPDNWVN
ncbi:MAG TPA: rhomboid family intramembrane serine protease [Candidatus Acidoferrales bacterium]|nr:rhomboid family intramembrane serine protease [Candidatus Acidoferrales bacterium]